MITALVGVGWSVAGLAWLAMGVWAWCAPSRAQAALKRATEDRTTEETL